MNGFRECITKARGYTPHGFTSSAKMEKQSPYFMDLNLSDHELPTGSKSDVTPSVSATRQKKKKSLVV